MATLSSTGRFAAGEACADNDILYGPYATTAAAHAALLNAEQNVVGRTVGIQTGNTIEEYWYQGGTTEQHLVKKQVAAQEETDPTVPSWAKQSNKPSYDYSEIGNTPDLSGFITKSVNDLTNYYLKSETYTKAEVAALIAAIQQFHYEIYATLPQTGQGNVLYLIGPTGSGSDKYEEYVYTNNAFTKIGDTSIDLSGYVTTSALNTALADYTTTSNLTALLSNKADKVSNATNGNFAGLDANGNLNDSGSKASDFATASQGVKADTAYQKPSSGIPESDLSSDVQQALQKHFKGWLTSTSQLPSNPVVGDYAYVEDNGTTYIYRCATDGEWPSTSTEEKDPVDVTFADGQEVNEVHIVNDLTTGGTKDVLSAEQGKKLYYLWFVDYMSGLQSMKYYNTHNKSIGSTMLNTASNSSESSAYSCMKLECTAGDKFLIFGKGSTNDYGRLWTFTNANNVILSMNEISEYVANGDIIVAPANAAYLYVNFIHYDSNTDKLQRQVKSSEIISSIDGLGSEVDGIKQELYSQVFTDNSVYENDILEVFSTININPAESEYVQLKCYSNNLYYRFGKKVSATTTWYWVVNPNVSTWVNNTIYPLVVTEVNADGTGVSVGDTIGYIVFKDIEHFKTNSSTSTVNNQLNVSRLTDISYAPKINASILLKEDEPQDLEPTYLDGVEVNLPDEIVVSKGDRLQIFWRNVCTAFNPYAFDVIGVCNVGLSYPRYFEYTPDDSVTNNTTHQLTVIIKDNAGRVVSQKATTIRVVDKIQTPATSKNVLIIGASATASGNIIYELNRRLNTSTGYEYKWKQSGGGLPDVHLGDVYKDSLDNEFTVTTIGTDFIGVVKTLSVSTDKTLRTVTLVSGDPTSPQSFVLEVVASSYPKVYDKPYGLGTQKFNFVGTTSPELYPDLHQEARGGWSWGSYATSGRSAYRFYVTEQQGIMEGAKYQGNGTLVFTVTNDIQLDASGNGNFSCKYTGSGTQPASGTLTKVSGNGPAVITYDSFSIDSQNPFWNNTTNQLDLDNYAANIINVESVDLVIFHLGVNDIFSSRTPTDCVGYMHTLIDAIHSAPQFANAKIIVSTLPMPSPYGGMTTNYGASNENSYFAKAKKFWIYGDAFNDFAKERGYSEFVQLATPLHTFDAEHLYPQKNIQVDNRCSETEAIQTNGVHPIVIGGYTVADDIYHSIMKVMQ